MDETFRAHPTPSQAEDMTMKRNPRIPMLTLLVLFAACSTQAIDVGSTITDGGDQSQTGGMTTLPEGTGGSIVEGTGGTGGTIPAGTGGAAGSVASDASGGSPGGAGGVASSGGSPVGGFAGTGGGLASPSCSDLVVASTANNYTASTKLSFPIIKVKPKSDLLFDWAGATTDVMGHAMSPSTDIQSVVLLVFALTPAETQAGINADTVSSRDLVVVPASLVTDGRTSAHLSDLNLSGNPLDLDVYMQYFDPDYYPPAETTYAFVVETGTELLKQTKLYQFFQLDPASTNTLVSVTPASTQLTAVVDLHSLTPAQIPANRTTGSLDFRTLPLTAEGAVFNPDAMTTAFIGHYTQSPADLEGKLVDLDRIAIDVYRSVVQTPGVVDFSTMISGSGKVFPGVDSTGTWLLGLQCGYCHDPTPQYLTVLAPCSTLLGVACDLGPDAPAGPSVAVYNDAAPECGAGLCIKPVVASTVSADVDTAPYCTWTCSQDRDCTGGAVRGSTAGDKACVSGYTCGIEFVKGKHCCTKMCLCKDFTGPGPIATPVACEGDGPATCQ
jgi:hypothetical protein